MTAPEQIQANTNVCIEPEAVGRHNTIAVKNTATQDRETKWTQPLLVSKSVICKHDGWRSTKIVCITISSIIQVTTQNLKVYPSAIPSFIQFAIAYLLEPGLILLYHPFSK